MNTDEYLPNGYGSQQTTLTQPECEDTSGPLLRICEKVQRLTMQMEELREVVGHHADRVWGVCPSGSKESEVKQVAGGGAFSELENAVNLANRAFDQLREQSHRNCELA